MIMRMALRDLLHEPVQFFCNVAMMVGVIAPLVLLFGAKNGVVSNLITDLRSDPELLRIHVQGEHDFQLKDIVELRARDDVGFVVQDIRSISRRILLQSADGGPITRANLLPGGPDDPIVQRGHDIQGGKIAMSQALATRLKVEVGDVVTTVLNRGNPPKLLGKTGFEILEVIPSRLLAGHGVVMDPIVMDQIEAFYDGYAVTPLGISEGENFDARNQVFENMRIYAQGLDDVGLLAQFLQEKYQVPIKSRASEIQRVQDLNANLNLALLIIVVAAIIGLLASMASSQWAEVERKKRPLATMALMGFTAKQRALLPVIQSLVTTMTALFVTLLVVLMGQASFELLLASSLDGRSVVQYSLIQVMISTCLILLLSMGASAAAAFRASKIEPAMLIRGET